MQRLVTQSEYDHVGMLFRGYKGQLQIVEAIRCKGVTLTYWQKFIEYKWSEQYDKVVYRHLHYDRSKETIKKLEEFVSVNLYIK